ncbi:MAG: hypothetical protein ACFFA1_07625, partial [Promethearchaeota archaeon]
MPRIYGYTGGGTSGWFTPFRATGTWQPCQAGCTRKACALRLGFTPMPLGNLPLKESILPKA